MRDKDNLSLSIFFFVYISSRVSSRWATGHIGRVRPSVLGPIFVLVLGLIFVSVLGPIFVSVLTSVDYLHNLIVMIAIIGFALTRVSIVPSSPLAASV